MTVCPMVPITNPHLLSISEMGRYFFNESVLCISKCTKKNQFVYFKPLKNIVYLFVKLQKKLIKIFNELKKLFES